VHWLLPEANNDARLGPQMRSGKARVFNVPEHFHSFFWRLRLSVFLQSFAGQKVLRDGSHSIAGFTGYKSETLMTNGMARKRVAFGVVG
jgi:hypothetical protein